MPDLGRTEPTAQTPKVWEVERDRFGVMIHPEIEVGECIKVAQADRLTFCDKCGNAATWCASDRDERNEPVSCCAFCGERL